MGKKNWYILYINVVTDKDKELENYVISKLKQKEEFKFHDEYTDLDGNKAYQVSVDLGTHKEFMNAITARIEDLEKYV